MRTKERVSSQGLSPSLGGSQRGRIRSFADGWTRADCCLAKSDFSSLLTVACHHPHGVHSRAVNMPTIDTTSPNVIIAASRTSQHFGVTSTSRMINDWSDAINELVGSIVTTHHLRVFGADVGLGVKRNEHRSFRNASQFEHGSQLRNALRMTDVLSDTQSVMNSSERRGLLGAILAIGKGKESHLDQCSDARSDGERVPLSFTNKSTVLFLLSCLSS